ncbi:MAG: TRAP transporter small permease [Clostridiales Family XIII bacterium]|nr:TRAP transporter small permease [Clostridiales Family XIII bacterium]
MSLLTGLLVAIACYQIAARYVFGWGISWSEESMRYIFVATVMVGIYFVSKSESFATLTVFSDFVAKKSPGATGILRAIRYVAEFVFYATLFYYGCRVCVMALGRVSTATHTPFTLIYAPIPIGAFMGCVNTAVKCVSAFKYGRKSIEEKGVEINAD